MRLFRFFGGNGKNERWDKKCPMRPSEILHSNYRIFFSQHRIFFSQHLIFLRPQFFQRPSYFFWRPQFTTPIGRFHSLSGGCIFSMPQNRVGEKHTKCVTSVHNQNAHKGKFHNRNAAKIHKWTQKRVHLYTHLQTYGHIAKYDVCLFHGRVREKIEISINQQKIEFI